MRLILNNFERAVVGLSELESERAEEKFPRYGEGGTIDGKGDILEWRADGIVRKGNKGTYQGFSQQTWSRLTPDSRGAVYGACDLVGIELAVVGPHSDSRTRGQLVCKTW